MDTISSVEALRRAAAQQGNAECRFSSAQAKFDEAKRALEYARRDLERTNEALAAAVRQSAGLSDFD